MKNTLGGQFLQARRGRPTRVQPVTHPKPKRTSRPLTSGQRKLKWREQAKSLIEVGLDDERRMGTGKR